MQNITPSELSQLLEDNKVTLIDVRESCEHDSVRIKDSILIPSSNFDEKQIPKVEGKKIVFYCKSGARSSAVVSKLDNPDYYNLVGGISLWIANGYSVVRGESAILPLDRQVQLTIGLSAAIFSILAIKYNPMFALVPLFFGCGLTFAGLTGRCGLLYLLAKAPWNKSIKQQDKSCGC